jgi:hypothetical protein
MKKTKTVRDGGERVTCRETVIEPYRQYCVLTGSPLSTIVAKALDFYAKEKLAAVIKNLEQQEG